MILLCDEDVGTGIPHALADAGLQARALVKIGLAGMDDTDWLPVAGRNRWLEVRPETPFRPEFNPKFVSGDGAYSSDF